MSDDTFTRTCFIRAGREDGVIEGTLATNGESDDGHIIDISGMRAEAGAPLLFGHDDRSGTRNLGSWLGFHRAGPSKMRKLGDQELRGTAVIETSAGDGANLAFRRDIAAMVAEGHIRSFSARGRPDESELPVQRTSLPQSHPAYVDSRKADSAQRWGLYFPRSVLAEGSVVTLGADPAAVMRHLEALDDIERMRPWLLELDLTPEQGLTFYRMAIGAVSESPPPSPVEPDPAETQEEPAPEPASPPEPAQPMVAPVPPVSLAEGALEQIRSAFPEFVNEAPDLVRQMTEEVFGSYETELRQTLDDYAYKRLGRVPPRR